MGSLLPRVAAERILVFGATGSFGCVLAECLACEEVQVVVFVRSDTLLGKKDRVDRLKLAGVDVLEGDFGSPGLASALKGVDTVVSCLSGDPSQRHWKPSTSWRQQFSPGAELSQCYRCCFKAATGAAGACKGRWSAAICAI